MVATRLHPSNFPPPLSPSKKASSSRRWIHAPTALTLLWLLLSLPLVAWDSVYVIGRPHTMPGGKWHEPLYVPYALYGSVDYGYGWPAYESGNGFTMAQGSLNVLESICYIGYLYIFWRYGEGQWTYARGQQRSIGGGWGGLACLLGFSVSLLTFSKTLLYGMCRIIDLPIDWMVSSRCMLALNEHFSNYHYIGHNNASRLFFLWILPK